MKIRRLEKKHEVMAAGELRCSPHWSVVHVSSNQNYNVVTLCIIQDSEACLMLSTLGKYGER